MPTYNPGYRLYLPNSLLRLSAAFRAEHHRQQFAGSAAVPWRLQSESYASAEALPGEHGAHDGQPDD